MAQHASAEKRHRQSEKRTARNRSVKSAIRTELKKARKGIAASPADAVAHVKAASGAVDRAASKGVIPKKRASRLKSRIARAAAKAAQAPSAE